MRKKNIYTCDMCGSEETELTGAIEAAEFDENGLNPKAIGPGSFCVCKDCIESFKEWYNRRKEFNPDPYKRDCYHFYENHDMNATVPCCRIQQGYGIRPCKTCKDCDNYVSKETINQIVDAYLEGRIKHEPEKGLIPCKNMDGKINSQTEQGI